METSLAALAENNDFRLSVMSAWQPKGVGNDPPSTTLAETRIQIYGSQDTLVLPLFTNTKVVEVKTLLEERLGVDKGNLKFVHKQGSSYRQNHDWEECARKVVVHGIDSFKRSSHHYKHPHVIIGAGHIGLKFAMTWLMDGYTNFMVIDRRDRVGGTSWIDQANTTSRLQTEVGVYHLEYHEKNGWPASGTSNPWPSRDQLLDHFQEVSERFGILPYCRMNTDVSSLAVQGKDYWQQSYSLTVKTKGSEEEVIEAASVSFFPGNLTRPKRVTYPGEDNFAGDIVYGISSCYDYSKCRGTNVMIVGSGAFAVENVRTCVEYAAKKVYMVCRRKTISMPRIVSWLINQSKDYISAVLTLEASQKMYDLLGVSVWDYYAVIANESRTNVTIKQKARFGIGDVYFLATACGMCEHIVDDTKRVTASTVHLQSGRRLEDISAILKLLGFNGEFDNDRLMKLTELYGFWCNKDYRRYIVAEPIFVDANNFSSTSFSPGAISWSEQQAHLLKFPRDWQPVMDSSAMPVHKADPENDRPAYVVEARHGALTAITLGAMVRGIGERGAVTGPLKRQRQLDIHPLRLFLECAKKEWDEWRRMLEQNGYVKTPEYPYSLQDVEGYLRKEEEDYAKKGRA
eukprot:TRINITY_DN16851_c0_g1_i1.p1 TRINITY_DN16851_c0_g1~~TRINITY_DN16851_c0_g1_i1.p1  ORF type:complete len:628 (-),score=131.60 TRINITY_DN16851_c0_g1_i1:36-1919(-)